MRILLRWLPELLLFCLIFFSFQNYVFADEWGIDILGISYHLNNTDSKGNRLNGINPGLGLHYEFRETRKSLWTMDGGVYRSSGRVKAEFFSAAAQYKWKILRLGIAMTMLHSAYYNNGNVFVAPLPLFSCRIRSFTLHFLPLPSFGDLNRNAAIAVFTTWHFK